MLMLVFVGVEEAFEALILVITLGVGIIIVEVMDGAMMAVLEMYMVYRGGRGVMRLIVEPIGAIINGVTGGLAPGKTVATAIGIWLINHPSRIEQAVEKAAGGLKRIGNTTAATFGGVATLTEMQPATVTVSAGATIAEQPSSVVRQRTTLAGGTIKPVVPSSASISTARVVMQERTIADIRTKKTT